MSAKLVTSALTFVSYIFHFDNGSVVFLSVITNVMAYSPRVDYVNEYIKIYHSVMKIHLENNVNSSA